MKRSPLIDSPSAPGYPPRRRGRAAVWARRAFAAGAVACSLGLGACGGGGGGSESPLLPRYAGGEAMPEYACGDEAPEYHSYLTPSVAQSGETCGEQTAWAAIEIHGTGYYRATLTHGSEQVSAALINPDGLQIAQLDSEMSSVNLEMTPGTWLVAVTANDPVTTPYAAFEFVYSPL